MFWVIILWFLYGSHRPDFKIVSDEPQGKRPFQISRNISPNKIRLQTS
jgi:hypothetical protein